MQIYCYSEKPLISVAFYDAVGDTGTFSCLKLIGSQQGNKTSHVITVSKPFRVLYSSLYDTSLSEFGTKAD